MIQYPMVAGGTCVLAGDIGSPQRPKYYRDYLLKLKDQFEHVILVLGNHEFYEMEYVATLEAMKKIADKTGVILMDIELGTENITIDGVTIFGSTLWTDFDNNNPNVKYRVGRSLNEYFLVANFDTDRALEIHNRTVEKINWNAYLVVTHHMPILREHSKFPIDDVTFGFCCNDLEQKIIDSNIKYWFYGHTHDNDSYEVGKTQVISNQQGYRMEFLSKEYDPNFSIEL